MNRNDVALLERILTCPDLSGYDRGRLEEYKDKLLTGARSKLKTKEREWALDVAARFSVQIPVALAAPAPSNVRTLHPAAKEAFSPPEPAALDRENLVLCPLVPPHRRCTHNRDKTACSDCREAQRSA